jgi:NAD(P)-dependent dehydrogenase (short-subunit alcohol dehydrogenase family)
VLPTVAGVAAPFDGPDGFQPVDEAHECCGIEPDPCCKVLLAEVVTRRGRCEDDELATVDAQFDQVVVECLQGASGIGLACARGFARLGADLVLGDVSDDALAAAATELASERCRVATVHCDVRVDADNAALRDAATALGPIGVVMLNAGISSGGALEHIPIAQWDDLFAVNVIGVARGLQAFMPVLMAQEQPAHVVITGSSASFFGSDLGVDAPYVASKHALLGMARAYRSYLARHGVTVQLLAPRMTDTAFPRSSIAWSRRGSFVTTDRDIGEADTAEQVASKLAEQLGSGPLVVALDPATADRLADFARTEIA